MKINRSAKIISVLLSVLLIAGGVVIFKLSATKSNLSPATFDNGEGVMLSLDYYPNSAAITTGETGTAKVSQALGQTPSLQTEKMRQLSAKVPGSNDFNLNLTIEKFMVDRPPELDSCKISTEVVTSKVTKKDSRLCVMVRNSETKKPALYIYLYEENNQQYAVLIGLDLADPDRILKDKVYAATVSAKLDASLYLNDIKDILASLDVK